MAKNEKKSKNRGEKKTSSEKPAAKSENAVVEKAAAKTADKVADVHDHDHDHDHAHETAGHDHSHAAGAHHHKPNRREYLVIFFVLAVLTALEIGVAQMKSISHSSVVVALICLALTKAGCVGLYFMHLK